MIEAKIIGTMYHKKHILEKGFDVLSCNRVKENNGMFYLVGTRSDGAYYKVSTDDYYLAGYKHVPTTTVEENLKQIEDHKAAIKELELLVDKQMNPHGYFKKEGSKSEVPLDTITLDYDNVYNFTGEHYTLVRWDLYNTKLVCSFEPRKKVHYAEKSGDKK